VKQDPATVPDAPLRWEELTPKRRTDEVQIRTAISLGLLAGAVLTGCAQAEATPPTTTTTSSTTMTSTTTSSPPTTSTTTTTVGRPVVVAPPATPRAERPTATITAGARCGNNLPPCSVCMRESRCTYGIVSNGGCSGWNCYGKWQFDPTTWRAVVHRYGLTDIPDWPVTSWAQVTPAMEDRVAAALWDHGRGCGHWNACG
jgi:hypothetical protein